MARSGPELPRRRCLHSASPFPAGVAQWQSPSLPSWPCRFDPGHPLQTRPTRTRQRHGSTQRAPERHRSPGHLPHSAPPTMPALRPQAPSRNAIRGRLRARSPSSINSSASADVDTCRADASASSRIRTSARRKRTGSGCEATPMSSCAARRQGLRCSCGLGPSTTGGRHRQDLVRSARRDELTNAGHVVRRTR
jgi:hypothetical protein